MNSATHISRSIYVRVVIVVVAMGLGPSLGFAQSQPPAKPQAQSQTAASSPCGAAATSGSAANQSAASASAAVKNAANAVSNLGSLFGKKKPAQPANQQPQPDHLSRRIPNRTTGNRFDCHDRSSFRMNMQIHIDFRG